MKKRAVAEGVPSATALSLSGEPGGFALAGRAACSAGAPFLFAKRNGGKKRRRGELLVPLSTPLQKGGLFGGRPILAGYNAFRIGGKPGIGHAMFWKYRCSRMKAGMRFGGVQRGVSPLWAFFLTAFFAKKAVLPPSRRPARRAHLRRGPCRAGHPSGEDTPPGGSPKTDRPPAGNSCRGLFAVTNRVRSAL